jgi:hypothetical protein
MPNKNATRRKYRPQLNQEHYAIYWLLLHAFECDDEKPGDWPVKINITAHGHADYVWGRVRALAKLAGITHDLATSPRATNGKAKISIVFDDAMKAVYMRAKEDEAYDAAPAFRIAERMTTVLSIYEREREERRGQTQDARKREKMSGKSKPIYVLVVSDDTLHNLGLVKGEEADVYEVKDLKLGEAGAVERRGEDIPYCGRVVASDADSITIKASAETWTIPRAEIARLGRVDHLSPRKGDALSEAGRKLVNKLRGALEDIDGEDDQILRCSARYLLEKKIFDIEHPAVDANDWSAWEERAD